MKKYVGKHEGESKAHRLVKTYWKPAAASFMAVVVVLTLIFWPSQKASTSHFKAPQSDFSISDDISREDAEKPVEGLKMPSGGLLEPVEETFTEETANDATESPVEAPQSPSESVLVSEPITDTPEVEVLSEPLKMPSMAPSVSVDPASDAEYLETVPSDIPGYSQADLIAVTNMVYGEISVIQYDVNISTEDQDLAMQEWARVCVNHLAMGLADNMVDLMSKPTGAGYYIWYPPYGTEAFHQQALKTDAGRWNRCYENVCIALSGQMTEEVPDNVIYADLAPHGSGVFKAYLINTGYYTATVYLSFA